MNIHIYIISHSSTSRFTIQGCNLDEHRPFPFQSEPSAIRLFALLFDQTARFPSVPFPFSQTIIIAGLTIDRPLDRS